VDFSVALGFRGPWGKVGKPMLGWPKLACWLDADEDADVEDEGV